MLCAGDKNEWVAGERKMLVVIEFPSVDAAKAWEADPKYGAVKGFRLSGTTNRFEVIAPQFTMPG